MDNDKIARAYMAYWVNYWVVSKKSTRYEYGSVLFMTMLLLLIQLVCVFMCWMLQLSFLGQVCQWFILGFVSINLIPLITLSLRRLKDNGKSWWWIVLAPIPIVNLVLFYFFCLPSSQEAQSQRTSIFKRNQENGRKKKHRKKRSSRRKHSNYHSTRLRDRL